MLLLSIFVESSDKGERIVKMNERITNEKKVSMDFDFADEIKISSWNRNEISVEVSVNINDNDNNENYTIKSKRDAGIIYFDSKINGMNRIRKRVSTVRRENGKNVLVSSDNVEFDIYYNIKVPNNISVEVSTITGNIEIRNTDDNIKAKSISGDVDLSWREKSGADFSLSTISGDMYSDLNFKSETDDTKKYGLYKLNTIYKSGGKSINLKSISGDIFIRKSK